MPTPNAPTATVRPPAPVAAPSRVGRLVGRPAFWVLFVGVLFALPLVRGLRTPMPPAPRVYGTLPPFELVDQSGGPYGSEQLRGRVWVANFIFTRCPTVCPRLTSKMFDIQHRTRNLGETFHLVSFTVDPEHDTPAVLRDYAREHRASQRAWTFLTGERPAVEAALLEGFKVGFGADEGAPLGIFHSSRFVLVDQEMRVRGYYDVEEEGQLDLLLRDAGLLCNVGA